MSTHMGATNSQKQSGFYWTTLYKQKSKIAAIQPFWVRSTPKFNQFFIEQQVWWKLLENINSQTNTRTEVIRSLPCRANIGQSLQNSYLLPILRHWYWYRAKISPRDVAMTVAASEHATWRTVQSLCISADTARGWLISRSPPPCPARNYIKKLILRIQDGRWPQLWKF